MIDGLIKNMFSKKINELGKTLHTQEKTALIISARINETGFFDSKMILIDKLGNRTEKPFDLLDLIKDAKTN